MKNFGKLLTLGFMVLSIVSCGKDNDSGGSSVSSTTSTVSSTGVNYKTYEEIKSAYSGMSFASGVQENMVVYHIGSDYGGSSITNNIQDFDFSDLFDFNFDFCMNINGNLKGDCDSNQGYNQGTQLSGVVSRGEYKVVKTLSKDSISLDIASGVYGQGFEFDPGTYNRNDAIYKEMLNLEGKSVVKVVISEAQITILEGTTTKQIKADYVEYFYSDYSLKGFVLSTAFPVMANPIANTKNNDLTGVLSFSGNKTVQSISVNIHDLQYDYMTNTYKTIAAGTRSIRF
ncbi:MAG: hypothetical protein ACJAS4_003205 [Bacteriovoracaceae bacterium]|jgi:hypothetical protein